MQRFAMWTVLFTAVVALCAFAARRPLLTAMGSFLVVQDDLHAADAIVVLSGSLPDRILEAVDLFQAHLAPRIVLTREDELPGLAALRARGGVLPEHHEQNIAVAEQLGVPANAIAVVPLPVASTRAEASAVVAYLRERQIASVILVTSKAHARRARMIFRACAGNQLWVTVRVSRYDPFTPEAWWQNRAWARRVAIEYLKLLNYVLIDQWRAGCGA